MKVNNNIVSIIVPVKNEAKRLSLLLPSLVNQTYSNFEVIINDDLGTNDETPRVIKSFSGKIKIIYIHKNKSMAQARLEGARSSRGQYLLHLDADMTLSPKVLQACIEKVKMGYDAIIIPEISFGDGYWSKVKTFERSMYTGDDTMESARFVKAKIYNEIGGHNEKMVLSEDKDLDLRIRAAGYKINRITEPIYHNEGSLSLKKDLKKKFFYGKTAHVFIKENPKHALNQANLIFRAAYFRNWKKLITEPVLSIGMFLMKILESLAALLGLMSAIQVIFTEKTLESLEHYEPMKESRIEKGLISIIVPTLNANKHLETLLPSLEKQTNKHFEVIINDDKLSSDDTKELLKQFEKKLKIKYMRENISMAQGRKSGVKNAVGEYLLHIDADMSLSSGVLSSCLKTIANGYDALVIPEISYGDGFWSKVRIFERSMYVGDDTIESARFFKASVYRSVGGHNEKMVLSEDKDIDLRIRKLGYRVGRIVDPIHHNEGDLRIFNDLKKKFFYGRTANMLMLTNPAYALKYGNIVLRPAFFRNWKKLLSHPFLASCVFLMKTLETIAGLLGMISSKIPSLKEEFKVHIWK